MDDRLDDPQVNAAVTGPPRFEAFDHVSLPCRDLEEGKRFYQQILGGEMVVSEGAFAQFRIAEMKIGIGSAGTTFMTEGAEYPHIAFKVGPEEQVRMKQWLTACGIPTSGFWTRGGVETLMFFLDPSGNVIELYCYGGYEGAAELPRGPARGHGTAIDIDALGYSEWRVPGEGA